jgi:hypothetical protein
MGRTNRANRAQRVAEEAWDQLVSAVDNAGDAARSAGRRTYDEAGSRASAVAGEARRRAGAALDALAGRRPRLHWEWIAGAAVVGLVVGWVAAGGARKAVGDSAVDTSGRRHLESVSSTDTLDSSASPEY